MSENADWRDTLKPGDQITSGLKTRTVLRVVYHAGKISVVILKKVNKSHTQGDETSVSRIALAGYRLVQP